MLALLEGELLIGIEGRDPVTLGRHETRCFLRKPPSASIINAGHDVDKPRQITDAPRP